MTVFKLEDGLEEEEYVLVFTHCHVGSTASAAGLGFGVNKASTDAKVAKFDLTFSIEEDVGGFDVTVDDTMCLFKVLQRFHNLDETCTEDKDSRYKSMVL